MRGDGGASANALLHYMIQLTEATCNRRLEIPI